MPQPSLCMEASMDIEAADLEGASVTVKGRLIDPSTTTTRPVHL